MIPLRDTIPSRTVPIVRSAILAACVGVFVLQLLAGNGGQALVDAFGFVPARLFHSAELGPGAFSFGVFGLFASMFLHGGLLHLAGNMLFLWIFGDNVEDALGPVLYPLAYLVTGVAGSLLHYAASPGSTIPTIGASGAISGVMGAYFVLYPRARVLTVIPVFFLIRLLYLPAWLLLGFWILFQVLNGCAAGPAGSGVAYLAHVGGFGAGIIVGLLAKPKVRRPWYEIH